MFFKTNHTNAGKKLHFTLLHFKLFEMYSNIMVAFQRILINTLLMNNVSQTKLCYKTSRPVPTWFFQNVLIYLEKRYRS